MTQSMENPPANMTIFKGANLKKTIGNAYPWSFWYEDNSVITSCRTEEEAKFYIELEYQYRQDMLASKLKGI